MKVSERKNRPLDKWFLSVTIKETRGEKEKKMKATKEEKENARVRLLDLCALSPVADTTVYCVLRHVASSGMSRNIDLFVMRSGEPTYISGLVATLTGFPMAKKGGIRVCGCGMDMGFALVYQLAQELYGPDKGYSLKSCWL
jgi:hypothetical protein